MTAGELKDDWCLFYGAFFYPLSLTLVVASC